MKILIKQLNNPHEETHGQTDYRSDYQQGFTQAYRDYQQHHCFEHYPESLISLSNNFFDHRLDEIAQFINGYKDGRMQIEHGLD